MVMINPPPIDMPAVESPRGEALEYVGFGPRLGALLVDVVLLMVITVPLTLWVYGAEGMESDKLIKGPADVIINWVAPAVAILIFWKFRGATPGKMFIGARIVDATTGRQPSMGQLLGRYVGYIVSTIPLFLGYLWVIWDEHHEAWHDKMSGTVVVRPFTGEGKPVRFPRHAA